MNDGKIDIYLILRMSEIIPVFAALAGFDQDKNQCDALKDMNVDLIQGYLFDKPLSVDDFEQKYLY